VDEIVEGFTDAARTERCEGALSLDPGDEPGEGVGVPNRQYLLEFADPSAAVRSFGGK
jgi:hypothetical protein